MGEATTCPRCKGPTIPVVPGVILCPRCGDVLTRGGVMLGLALYVVSERLIAAREALRELSASAHKETARIAGEALARAEEPVAPVDVTGAEAWPGRPKKRS